MLRIPLNGLSIAIIVFALVMVVLALLLWWLCCYKKPAAIVVREIEEPARLIMGEIILVDVVTVYDVRARSADPPPPYRAYYPVWDYGNTSMTSFSDFACGSQLILCWFSYEFSMLNLYDITKREILAFFQFPSLHAVSYVWLNWL